DKIKTMSEEIIKIKKQIENKDKDISNKNTHLVSQASSIVEKDVKIKELNKQLIQAKNKEVDLKEQIKCHKENDEAYLGVINSLEKDKNNLIEERKQYKTESTSNKVWYNRVCRYYASSNKTCEAREKCRWDHPPLCRKEDACSGELCGKLHIENLQFDKWRNQEIINPYSQEK
ncbi:unnamed protein product, partial [Meganyctiphanes norvegica]